MRFSRFRTLFFILSMLSMLALYAVTFFHHGGFARSIAFNGGFRFTIQFDPDVSKEQLETKLKGSGFADAQVRLASARLNQFDLEFEPDVLDGRKLVASPQEASPSDSAAERGPVEILEAELLSVLPISGPEWIISREKISASYGEELAELTFYTLLACIGVIGIYLSARFTFPFALGASLALLHDVFFTIAFIGVMQIKPSIPVVAALLTVIGYSINDTIVIFDRIRDTLPEGSSIVPDITDMAITQTLSRTIITSLATVLVIVALIFGGATSLYDFAVIILFGILVGTYSSIFIASHFVQWYVEWRSS